MPYRLSEETGLIDYDALERTAELYRCGTGCGCWCRRMAAPVPDAHAQSCQALARSACESGVCMV